MRKLDLIHRAITSIGPARLPRISRHPFLTNVQAIMSEMTRGAVIRKAIAEAEDLTDLYGIAVDQLGLTESEWTYLLLQATVAGLSPDDTFFARR